MVKVSGDSDFGRDVVFPGRMDGGVVPESNAGRGARDRYIMDALRGVLVIGRVISFFPERVLDNNADGSRIDDARRIDTFDSVTITIDGVCRGRVFDNVIIRQTLTVSRVLTFVSGVHDCSGDVGMVINDLSITASDRMGKGRVVVSCIARDYAPIAPINLSLDLPMGPGRGRERKDWVICVGAPEPMRKGRVVMVVGSKSVAPSTVIVTGSVIESTGHAVVRAVAVREIEAVMTGSQPTCRRGSESCTISLCRVC